MASSSSMVSGAEGRGRPRTFVDLTDRLHAELERDGVSVADMRRAEPLELQYAGVSDLGNLTPQRGGPVDIDRLEGADIVQRALPSVPHGSSRLRYFLDGSQRTVRVWRIGVVPVVATIAAAAVLMRDGSGQPTVAPGTLRLKHAWLFPKQSDEHGIKALCQRLEEINATVIDPLERMTDAAEYAAIAENYGRLLELSYRRARDVRDELERALLTEWSAEASHQSDDGWIVVDGPLKAPTLRAVGLVKELATQHLTGREAVALFSLPPGHRTTAYRHRSREQPADSPPESKANTMWYLRFWDAQGYDARHALVRVEAGPEVRASDQIDELSAWLMAERTPRATADARWATLLYPVHYLEQILKRRLAGETVGWPG